MTTTTTTTTSTPCCRSFSVLLLLMALIVNTVANNNNTPDFQRKSRMPAFFSRQASKKNYCIRRPFLDSCCDGIVNDCDSSPEESSEDSEARFALQYENEHIALRQSESSYLLRERRYHQVGPSVVPASTATATHSMTSTSAFPIIY